MSPDETSPAVGVEGLKDEEMAGDCNAEEVKINIDG